MSRSCERSPIIRQQVAALASGAFLAEAGGIVLTRPPGTGKTHLAIALGITAARHRHRVLPATATDWVTRLIDARRQGMLPQGTARLRRYELIVTGLCRHRDYAGMGGCLLAGGLMGVGFWHVGERV